MPLHSRKPFGTVGCAVAVATLTCLLLSASTTFVALHFMRMDADIAFVETLSSTEVYQLSARLSEVQKPAADTANSMASLFRGPAMPGLPSDAVDPLVTLHALRTVTQEVYLRKIEGLFSVVMFFIDGNRAVTRRHTDNVSVSLYTFASNSTNRTHRCCGIYNARLWDTTTGALVTEPVDPPMVPVQINTLSESFILLSEYAKRVSLEGWFGPYPDVIGNEKLLLVSYGVPIFN
jgi:hypothetical protein